MSHERHTAHGARFRELHQSGCFLMANVGDAGTAAALRDTGVDAIATSSSAHAQTIGRNDAAGDVSMEEHAEHTAALVVAGDLPVNVDAENGYGHEPDAMAAAVPRIAASQDCSLASTLTALPCLVRHGWTLPLVMGIPCTMMSSGWPLLSLPFIVRLPDIVR